MPEIEPVETTIDAAMLAAAERIGGFDFTPDERALMLARVAAARDGIVAMRGHALGNAAAPAFHFDPRPLGYRAPAVTAAPPEPVEAHAPDDLERLAFAPVRQLAALLRTRQVTSAQLTDMYLARLKRYGPQLACVATLTEELAREQAAQADREIAAGHDRGPLHGIPYGVKDLFATRGYPTGWGAPPYRGQHFDFDATVVSKLTAAGAVLVAKLSMGSLAMGDVWYGGKTKTPWDLTAGSSGSSAGSGAATAAGLVAFAIGTETNGSIVSPCTECGVTGLRPTFGRVSRHGAMTLAWTLDKVGPLCRSVDDCALVFDAIRGQDGHDASVVDAPFAWEPNIDPAGVRVGYVPALFDAEGPSHAADQATLATLRQLGVTLVPFDLPDLPLDAMQIILWVEAAAAFAELMQSDRDDLLVRQDERGWPNRLRSAHFIPAVAYLQAQRLRGRLIDAMRDRMAQFDAYVAPSYGPNLWLTNATGHPAAIVPNGLRDNGLPSTITFIGHYDDEARLLAVAKSYQTATDYHLKEPPLFAVAQSAAARVGLAQGWIGAIIAGNWVRQPADGRKGSGESGMAELTYYVNGEMVPASQAGLPLNDLGIVRGYGVFDLLRTYGTTPFRLRDHVRRLESSAQQIGLAMPWSTEELERIVLETYAANAIPDASIRIIVTGGPSANHMTPGNQPSLVVMVHPPSPLPSGQYAQGVKVVCTLVTRVLPTVKSINYMAAIMAMQVAGKVGGVVAVFLDDQDRVTEGTRANLFVVRSRRLMTARDGILKGITRQVVMEVAAPEFEVVECPIHYRDLAHMEEAFLTSTTKEVLPVIQIDDMVLGDGRPGPVTQRVAELFKTYAQSVAHSVAA